MDQRRRAYKKQWKEDSEEENLQKKKKKFEEPIRTSDDAEFSREGIKHEIESFNDKKAPEIHGITGGI